MVNRAHITFLFSTEAPRYDDDNNLEDEEIYVDNFSSDVKEIEDSNSRH